MVGAERSSQTARPSAGDDLSAPPAEAVHRIQPSRATVMGPDAGTRSARHPEVLATRWIQCPAWTHPPGPGVRCPSRRIWTGIRGSPPSEASSLRCAGSEDGYRHRSAAVRKVATTAAIRQATIASSMPISPNAAAVPATMPIAAKTRRRALRILIPLAHRRCPSRGCRARPDEGRSCSPSRTLVAGRTKVLRPTGRSAGYRPCRRCGGRAPRRGNQWAEHRGRLGRAPRRYGRRGVRSIRISL